MSDADKPDDLTIVTVKGMSVEAWKRGRKAAEKRDEMMGPWLSRAINLLADQQDHDGLFPPDKLNGKPVGPEDRALPPLPVFTMAELQSTLLAAQVAMDRRVPAEVMAEALLLLENAMRAANGRPLRRRPLPLHRLSLGFSPRSDETNLVPGSDKPGGTV
jgi:hypothetical protein